jgi:AraC-like DNA-binding protein
MNTIAWIGFCQSLFAAILMFTKKESSLPDKILSGWLTLLGIEFMTCGLDYEVFGQPLLSSSFLLFNPALYLYISSLTRPAFQLKWIQLLHLLPFVFFEVYAYVINEPFSLDIFFVRDENFLFRMAFGFSTIISWCVYNPLSLIFVHKHRMNLRNERSNIEKNENLGWVLGVGIFYVVYCLFALLITFIVYFQQLNPLFPHIYNYSMLLFMVFVLSFYGLRQQVLPQQLLIEEQPVIPYKNSTLSNDAKQKIKKKIIAYFETDKAYLNPELNMDLLSSVLKIPKYQITEVLNTEIGMNFFLFVNTYRVEAVKKMLSNPDNKYSIEAIGYDAGFSSKSSFYTVFKNMTGETPVSFRNDYFKNHLI